MGTVSYRGSKIIPAPLVDINKVYQKSPNGDILGRTYNITVNGTIVAFKGSPSSSGTFHTTSGYPSDETIGNNSRLAAIIRKQEALQALFDVEGGSFEVQSLDGSQPLKCNPRVVSINFPEGQWFNTCPYSITLEADRIYPLDTNDDLSLLNDFGESWSLDTDEQGEALDRPRFYRMSHTVSAVGKRFYDENGVLQQEPWEIARDYVLSRLGFDSTVALSSGVNNLPSYYGGFNHVRNENRDESNGSFAVTETWIVASGKALEDFTIETNKDIQSSLVRVGINGTITGLEERNSDLGLTVSKYDNALDRFSVASGLALSRAQTYSGYSLNIMPISERIGRNPITGTITYGFEFDTRPSNIVSGALSEVITVIDSLDSNTIAIIPVLGRAAGPVLQNLGTRPELTRQLTIELVMPIPSFGSNTLNDIQSALFGQRPTVAVSGIINAVTPAAQGYSQVYKTSDRETWNGKDGRYSRELTWVFE